jgi:hypothetical protein
VAEIIHPEQQDTAPPPLLQSAPKTVSAIIKATEGAAPPPPKGVTAHQWPPQRGPPSPLPTFIKFADLKAAEGPLVWVCDACLDGRRGRGVAGGAAGGAAGARRLDAQALEERGREDRRGRGKP